MNAPAEQITEPTQQPKLSFEQFCSHYGYKHIHFSGQPNRACLVEQRARHHYNCYKRGKNFLGLPITYRENEHHVQWLTRNRFW